MTENLIPINIVGAKVTMMGFNFEEGKTIPEFCATVSLIDDLGKNITSINIDSRSYYGTGGSCEKSIRLIELAAQLKEEVNTVITRHMNASRKILEAK